MRTVGLGAEKTDKKNQADAKLKKELKDLKAENEQLKAENEESARRDTRGDARQNTKEMMKEGAVNVTVC